MTDFFSNLNLIDLIIFAGLLTFVLLGIIRGFTSDMLGMMTWVGAILITSFAFSPVQKFIRGVIEQPLLADLVTLLLLFLGTLIILVFIAKTISKAVQKSILSGLDRSLGILSGALRGTIVLTLIFSGSLLFWHPGELPREMTSSRLIPLLASSSRFFYEHIVPQDLYPKRIIKHLYGPNRIGHDALSTHDLVHSLSNPKTERKTQETPTQGSLGKNKAQNQNPDNVSQKDQKALDALIREVN